MQLDDIVVICLALMFFGGIGYLAYRQRKEEGDQNTETVISSQPETPVSPQANNGVTAGRKKRKRRNR